MHDDIAILLGVVFGHLLRSPLACRGLHLDRRANLEKKSKKKKRKIQPVGAKTQLRFGAKTPSRFARQEEGEVEMHTNQNHESLLILTELTSIFTDEKDAGLICSIKEKESLIRARHEAKQAEMKNTIKGTLVLRAQLLAWTKSLTRSFCSAHIRCEEDRDEGATKRI